MKFPVTGIKEPARENKKRFKHCMTLITQQKYYKGKTKGTSIECSYLDTRVKFQMILGYKYTNTELSFQKIVLSRLTMNSHEPIQMQMNIFQSGVQYLQSISDQTYMMNRVNQKQCPRTFFGPVCRDEHEFF
jgi:hypothetical protein